MKQISHLFLSFSLLLSISTIAKNNSNLACPTATISYSAPSFCKSNSNLQNITLTGTDSYLGGIFSSSSGLSLNSMNGGITPSTSTPGVYTVNYTIPSGPGCPSTVVSTVIEIVSPPILPTDIPNSIICNHEDFYLTISSSPSNPNTTYYWTVTANNVNGATAGTEQGDLVIMQQLNLLFPDISGSVTYHVTPFLNGCSGNTVNYTVIVNPSPNTGLEGEISVSESSTTPIDLFSIITGEQAGGNWNRVSGTGGIFDAALGTFTPEVGATNSTFSYELTNNSTNCFSSTFATIIIDTIPSGLANTTNQTISNNDFSNIVLSSPNVPNSNFTWTFVANNISGASNGSGTTIAQQLSLIDINSNGYVDYFMTPINNTAIGTTFSARVNIQSPLSSESFVLDNFKLSPNPVVDNLNIENDNQIKNIKIYNQLGQMIFSNKINNTKKTLDLSNLSSGIYTIFIETNTRIITRKIMKQ